jgi:WD40 repeat protein
MEMSLTRFCWLLLWLAACAPTQPPLMPRFEPAPAPQPSHGPPATPFLRLETSGHTAPIRRIAVDAQARYVVSASDDKTARVWDLATGKRLQTLRPPLGEGHEGKLFAVAISPDGRIVAVAGWTGFEWDKTHSIYLFDRASGVLQQRLTGLPNVINHLAYSPDGRYLAAALWDGGIRVFLTADGKEIFRDTDYGADSYSVEFDRQNRFLTTCDDGLLRLYDAGFKLIAKQAAPGGKQPVFARFSPDGSRIAVGFYDSAAVNLLSGKDLHFLQALETQGANNGSLSAVAWSAEGQRLYAGGRYQDSSGWRPLLYWDMAGRGAVRAVRLSTDTLMDLRPLANGRLLFAAADPVLGLLPADGGKLWEKRGEILDFRHDKSRLRLSKEGATVEFGFDVLKETEWQRRLARFDWANRTLRLDTENLPPLDAPRTKGEARALWLGTLTPQIHGSRLTLENNEMSRSLALARQDSGFLLGTNFRLRYYDSPTQLRWQAPIPGVAWAVNLSADGRYAVAAFGDGTIRWYKTQKQLAEGEHREALALYVHPDGQRWVAWTPEGFYDAAPGAEGLVGYHLNHGADRAGEFVSGGQLAQTFLRPGLIARRLGPEGDKLMAEAVRELGRRDEVLAQLPPQVEVLDLQATDKPGEYAVEFKVDYRNGKPGEVTLLIDGKPQALGRRPGSPGGFDTVTVKLPPGPHSVRMGASNDLGTTSAPDDPAARREVRVPEYQDPPKLFMLAVGIHQYQDSSLNRGVAYAAADALAIAERFRTQGPKLYGEDHRVEVRELLDDKATGSAIATALEDVASKADVNDVFVLYLAGHGFAVNDEYHFVPWDDVKTGDKEYREKSLDEGTLLRLLKAIKANKSLVLLDSCASGTFNWGRGGDEKDAAQRLATLSGKAIIAATRSLAVAAREPEQGKTQGHGYFTSTLLEGFQGAADRGEKVDDMIDVQELAEYVQNRLPEISRQTGEPQYPYKELLDNWFVVLPKP